MNIEGMDIKCSDTTEIEDILAWGLRLRGFSSFALSLFLVYLIVGVG